MASPSSLDWASEVAVVVGFSQPLSSFRAEHIGLFWHLIREDYPNMKAQRGFPADRILRPALFSSLEGQRPGPTPRFTISSADGTHDLFLQRDRFAIWWHSENREHVDFPNVIRPVFDRFYSFFVQFIQHEFIGADIGADFCELSFAGEVTQPGHSSKGSKVLTWLRNFDVPTISAPLASLPEFDFTYYYDLSSGVQIKVGGQSVVQEDNGEPQVTFDFELEGSQRLGHATTPEVSFWLTSTYRDMSECYYSLVS